MAAFVAATIPMLSSCSSDEPNGGEESDNPTEEPVKPNEREDIVLTPQEAKMAKAAALRSYDFFRNAHKIEKESPDGADNLVVSPLSLSMAMSITANGAKGSTLNEILAAMGYGDAGLEAVNALNHTLLMELPDLDNTVEFSLSNSAWLRQDRYDSMEKTFATTLNDIYGSTVSSVSSFSNPETVQKINMWSSEATKGLVPKLFESPLSSDVTFVLANALYFKGTWKYEFSSSDHIAKFTNADGTVYEYPSQMLMAEDMHTLRNELYNAASLPYGNEAYSMVIVVPKTSLDEWFEKFDAEDIYALSKGESNKSGLFVEMPPFTVEYGSSMKGLLNTLGVKDAFDMEKADFSGIDKNGKMWLGEVIQKSKIDVDGKGTEAASVSGVTGVDSPGLTLNVDRPFAFIIAERSTGLPLFMGRVTKL